MARKKQPRGWSCRLLMLLCGALLLSVFLLPLCLTPRAVLGQAIANGGVETATQDRMDDPGWWPTKGEAPRNAFVGSQTCAQCHSSEFSTQALTPMANAGQPAYPADQLQKYLPLLFLSGTYTYRISATTSQVLYTASSNGQSVTTPLAWAFGSDERGQTYVYQKAGKWYESRVSLYRKLGGLDITTGHSHLTPEGLDEALGRPMNDSAAQRCFGCHTTASTSNGHFEPQLATPGITCEACHGPGSGHVTNMNAADKAVPTAITDAAHMSPVDSVDFCGSCHRTWADVAFSGAAKRGLEVVRFQPYRLEKSRCWGAAGDARITCVACHNPHQPLEHSPAAYDGKCLHCHLQRGQVADPAKPGKACPKSTGQCTSCHMPKYTLTEMHGDFTDHFIRIVRQGEVFPE